MTPLTLDTDTILRRMNGIQEEIQELEKLGKLPLNEFKGVNFNLAQFHLHRALEGMFHIGSHILSRIPGGQATEYKEIARKLGDLGMVDHEFAYGRLQQMAGYRNRLVHFYAEISPAEIHDILQNHLGDFDVFLKGVKNVLENPERFGIAA